MIKKVKIKISSLFNEVLRRRKLVKEEVNDVKKAIAEVINQLSHIPAAIKGEARKGRKKKNDK
tara:strand:+ start:1357 stop:1545 length:189 start_codon:yes stop_codon:yes gene_type:complete